MRRAAALLALLLAACAGAPTPSPSWSPVDPAWTAVDAEGRPVGLGVPGGVRLAAGVRFAGGAEIVAAPDSRLHSLSDLKLIDGDIVVVSDWGDLFRARLRLDRRGRLAGVGEWRMRPLTGDDGQPFPTKADGDAEGLAVTDDGRLFVSFEGDHRIRDYGPVARPFAFPAPLQAPALGAPGNSGFEALAIAPGGWRVAAEAGGVWDCTPLACSVVVAPPAEPLPDSEYRITGMDRDPAGGGWFLVERRFREPADVRGRVRRMDASGALGPVLVELTLPSTVDNFEGIAAVARDGASRLYILSDDNGSSRQRTLLLAFDVRPAR